jgi:excisionase family DNA binding protein
VKTRSNTESHDERLLRVDEVAQILAISVKTVWRLSKSGGLPEPVRVGRRVRWRALDIQNVIKGEAPTSRA